MRVALLCSARNDYGADLLAGLRSARHDVVMAIVVRRAPRARVRRLAERVGRDLGPGRTPAAEAARDRPAVAVARRRPAPDVLGAALSRARVPSVAVDSINGRDALAALRSARPELLLYAGAGILRRPILDIPSRGTLNAHMGMLPAYRGMNVLEWSVLHGDPLGVTIHFIDDGIDTGDVLMTRPVAVRPGDTIAALRDRAVQESVKGLVEAVDALRADTIRPSPQPTAGPQYFVMHRRLRSVAERRLERQAPAAAQR